MNEMPEVYCVSKRRARKEHKCCECYGKINSGQNYQYISGIWDSRPESYKTCLDCANTRDEAMGIVAPYYEDGPWLTGLYEWICEGDYKLEEWAQNFLSRYYEGMEADK